MKTWFYVTKIEFVGTVQGETKEKAFNKLRQELWEEHAIEDLLESEVKLQEEKP